MKILYVLSQWPCISLKFILTEMEELHKLGNTLEIAALVKPKTVQEHYSKLNIPVHYIQGMDIVQLVVKGDFQHLHAHFAADATRTIYYVHLKTNIPFTFTAHAFDLYQDPDPDLIKWCNAAKKVITISDYNKQHLIKKFGVNSEKITVIRCGVNIEEFAPCDYDNSKIHIVTVARFSHKKGLDILLAACSNLKKRDIKFNCTIVGGGLDAMYNRLVRIVKNYSLENNVKILTGVYHPETQDIIKSGSVAVLPCRIAGNRDMDGIPVFLMEAMALKIPVISTGISGIPELITNDETGILVWLLTSENIANAIVKISTDQHLVNTIRSNCRQVIEDKFNIEKNARVLCDVFHESISDGTIVSDTEKNKNVFFPNINKEYRVVRILRGFDLSLDNVNYCNQFNYEANHVKLDKICTRNNVIDPFNPSFLTTEKVSVMAFRAIGATDNECYSLIDIESKDDHVLLNLTNEHCSRLQVEQLIDPKVFLLDDEVWITFNNAWTKDLTGNKIFVLKIFPELGKPLELIYPQRAVQERNWAFFKRGDIIYVLYKIDPLKILILDKVTDTEWILKDFYTSTHKSCYSDITIGTQLTIYNDSYWFIAHRKYTYQRKKLYLGIGCRLNFDTKQVTFGSKWLVHSLDSMLGISYKMNTKLYSCTYFSGIQSYNDKLIIGYGINDNQSGFAELTPDQLLSG